MTIKEASVKSFHDTIAENLGSIRLFNILFATVIAFGVVYNNARISLAERSRDLATFRVIGFTRAEISAILLGELAVLTLAAIPLGMLVGYLLCGLGDPGAGYRGVSHPAGHSPGDLRFCRRRCAGSGRGFGAAGARAAGPPGFDCRAEDAGVTLHREIPDPQHSCCCCSSAIVAGAWCGRSGRSRCRWRLPCAPRPPAGHGGRGRQDADQGALRRLRPAGRPAAADRPGSRRPGLPRRDAAGHDRTQRAGFPGRREPWPRPKPRSRPPRPCWPARIRRWTVPGSRLDVCRAANCTVVGLLAKSKSVTTQEAGQAEMLYRAREQDFRAAKFAQDDRPVRAGHGPSGAWSASAVR